MLLPAYSNCNYDYHCIAITSNIVVLQLSVFFCKLCKDRIEQNRTLKEHPENTQQNSGNTLGEHSENACSAVALLYWTSPIVSSSDCYSDLLLILYLSSCKKYQQTARWYCSDSSLLQPMNCQINQGWWILFNKTKKVWNPSRFSLLCAIKLQIFLGFC